MFFAVTLTVWSHARNLAKNVLRFSLSTILVTSAALICLLHPESKHPLEVIMARRNRLSLPRPPFDDNNTRNSSSKIPHLDVQNSKTSPEMLPTARIQPTARMLSLKTTTPTPSPLTANHTAMMYADALNMAKLVVDAGPPQLF